MGFRFSKRISICKGVNLNVSKSGVGISLGVKGASISIGSRGTYLNTGIPGTGISYRQKITSSSNSNQGSSNIMEYDFPPGSTFQFKIDNDGNETFLLLDSSGRPFSNDYLAKKIKKSPLYKEIVEKARKEKNDYKQKQNDDIVYIYKLTPKIISVDDVIKERDDLSSVQQNYYNVRAFTEPQPRYTNFYEEANAFAKATVKTRMFWKKKEFIREATNKKMDELYKIAMAEWTARHDEFYLNENQIKKEKDAEFKKEYDCMIAERNKTYEQILNPSFDYLQETVSYVLSQIQLPVDFSIDYAVSDKCIELDIDLPEIENLPQTTSSILQSGKLSIKKKSVTELNKDYATSVVGMSFFFAGILFNISPAIEKISIAGYTQRVSKKTGNVEDQYIYSVTYIRDIFSKLNISNIDPLEAIDNFDHTINISSKYELKTIDVKFSENRKLTCDS